MYYKCIEINTNFTSWEQNGEEIPGAVELQNYQIVQGTTTYFLLFGFLKAVITPFELNPQLSLVTW